MPSSPWLHACRSFFKGHLCSRSLSGASMQRNLVLPSVLSTSSFGSLLSFFPFAWALVPPRRACACLRLFFSGESRRRTRRRSKPRGNRRLLLFRGKSCCFLPGSPFVLFQTQSTRLFCRLGTLLAVLPSSSRETGLKESEKKDKEPEERTVTRKSVTECEGVRDGSQVPRVSQPGISLESLPPIDVVLLSSVRFDAYDHAALRFLAKRDGSTFFVPNGVLARRYLSPRVFGNVYPMNWGDRVKFDENFLVFFCPAVHAAVGRYGVDWNVPGWGSFAVQWCAKERRGALVPCTKSVFFGGRSAYSRKMFDLIREGTRRDRETLRQEMETEAAFQREMERERRRRRGEEAVEEELVEEAAETEVGQRKGGGGEEGGDRFVFDLAILPVGGYEPREYMRRYQMSPEEAVEAHLRLESKLSLPSHFDVLPVGSEAFREAPSRLIAACNAKGVPVGGFTEHSDFDFSFKGSQKTDAGNGAGTAAQKATGYDKSSGEQGGFHILEPGAHFWVL